MTNRFWKAAALAAAGATAACAMGRRPPEKPAAPAAEKPMTIQEWKGQYGGPEEPGALVATDQGSWARAWKQVGKDAPPLDFTQYVAVMVFVGQKSTGGYSPVFDEPVAQGDDVVVRYRVPKPSGFTTQALAQPWKARAFPRPKGKLILREEAAQ
jgi:hypothetical protein